MSWVYNPNQGLKLTKTRRKSKSMMSLWEGIVESVINLKAGRASIRSPKAALGEKVNAKPVVMMNKLKEEKK